MVLDFALERFLLSAKGNMPVEKQSSKGKLLV